MKLPDDAFRVVIAVELKTEQACLLSLGIDLGLPELDHSPFRGGGVRALASFDAPAHMDGLYGGEMLDLRFRR